MRRAMPAILRHLRRLLAVATVCLAAGCSTNPEAERVFVFRAFRLANPDLVGGKLSRPLLDHEGTKVIWVHTVPLITSVNITDAEVVVKDGARAVRLQLDHFGQNVWLQMCKQLAGEDMAITVDGFYLFRTPIPHRQNNYESMLVEGPWNEAQARGVAAQASTNYRISNPTPGLQPF